MSLLPWHPSCWSSSIELFLSVLLLPWVVSVVCWHFEVSHSLHNIGSNFKHLSSQSKTIQLCNLPANLKGRKVQECLVSERSRTFRYIIGASFTCNPCTFHLHRESYILWQVSFPSISVFNWLKDIPFKIGTCHL